MTQSNARTLPKLPAEAIRLAHLLDSFFKTNKTWTGLSHPDQRVLIGFIAQKYDMGSTLAANHITRYPRIWAREEHRVTEAIQKTVDLASPLLDGSLRSVLKAKSIFDMPVKLMELIDRLDPNLGPTYAFPSFLAVRLNQQQTVEYLLDSKRLNVNKQTNTGQTALLEAIRVGNTDVIRMLAKAGANADIGMSEGRTARQQMSAAGTYIKWKTSSI
ncbi:hypothetical protein DTO013E5_242 [Penicillium roqueforti]|nr:hypothetical protein DTO012A1_1397 [Penicillium roqueforti]KAI2756678.1 hypothetical protein DTO013F2_93 [Penicillium roqueforti]KAI2764534.1 hypothetical protein DTO006G1_952 [Penicillium roqueforti]KAI3114141.1 hypothetical protein CBS147333_2376 [Penicillium roqueforti]KAI3209193.1 hypothetical protein CBS147311_1914 [Penicillium roqueforti]